MAQNYLDFYYDSDSNRISYTKDISLTQYSTAYTVRFLSKKSYPAVNMNATTGNGLKTYKKNLILSPTKTAEGFYSYEYTLGLDITGYQFQDEKSIVRLGFYIYPEKDNTGKVFTTNICYLPLLKAPDDMPPDGSITNTELNSLQGAINDINKKLADLNVGEIDTAKNYNKTEGTILEKFNEVDAKIAKNSQDISNLDVSDISVIKQNVAKNSQDISRLKEDVNDNSSRISILSNKFDAFTPGVRYTVSQELPSLGESGTIYLVPNSASTDSNEYTEYMWINSKWEIIGSTATSGDISLSNYYTKSESDDKYALKSNIPTKVSQLTNDAGYLTEHQDISNLATKEEVNNVSSSIPTKVSQLDNDSRYVNDATLNNTKNILQNQLDSHDSTLSSLATSVSESNRLANEALALARNVSSLVYNTFDDMINALKESIPGAIVGTNIFIKDMNVSDYWITSVLVSNTGSYTAPNGTRYTGLFYTISPIESKIDLSDYYSVSEADNKFATKTELNTGLSNKENTSNKVNTIDSTANNTTYPTTAAVKNYIKNTVDDINATIDNTYATKESLTSNVSTLTTKIEKVENDYKAADRTLQGSIDTLNTGLGEEIVRSKAYTDSKVTRDNLVSVIREASTTLNGLLSSEDKRRLDAMYAVFGENPDENTFVDTVNEVLNIFSQYPEGTNIVEYLNTKVNISDIVDNLTSEETAKPLSAKQGKILKDGITSGDIPSGAATSIIDRLDNKRVKLAFTGSETDYIVNDTDISSITTLLSMFSPNEYN